mmetsp:Transcript_68002/g.76132  ORF Transcript_68002/g.76132 Transcript_68002/m.76132 type:complete len:138 (-) Transcript_68002:57-470(-)|eukprot:CAMPEP_0170781638 /NCGR_PEP_ID=MMETSP0733-20121128/14336_1 /TAXON_ID=186038 /ORGANISM="Fragilariopsis kerguelensis, Strain L26-C5" /LENGTH=137 /DNA_ID=CAMNT_0011125751 /DNA_START=114 /DNA_END=527 /DNA_ORIENTATION=+
MTSESYQNTKNTNVTAAVGNSNSKKEEEMKGKNTKKHQIFIVTGTLLALLGVLVVTVGTNASGQHVMSSAAVFERDEGALIMDIFGSNSEKVREVGQYGPCKCIPECVSEGVSYGVSCCDGGGSSCGNHVCSPHCAW